jgi:hypothetical protein
MLARVSLASASVVWVKPAERVEKVKAYARARLREEVKAGPRGTQARIVEALGGTSAHVSNMVNHDRGPGPETLYALAKHWGMTYAQLEAEALGEAQAAPPQPTVVPSRVLDVLARVAKKRGYAADVLAEASRVRSVRGTGDMTEEDADDLLQLTKVYLRNAARIGTTTIAESGGSALDDLSGKSTAAPTPPARKRR